MKKEIVLQELESLIRSLDFIQEEQSFIKSKLSSLLENKLQQEVIVWAEELHQAILNRETAILLLKNDVLGLRNKIKTSPLDNEPVKEDIIKLFKKLKQQVTYMEVEFFSWKNTTNQNLESVVLV